MLGLYHKSAPDGQMHYNAVKPPKLLLSNSIEIWKAEVGVTVTNTEKICTNTCQIKVIKALKV